MVSDPLDVLNQYFGIFVKMGMQLVNNFLKFELGKEYTSEATSEEQTETVMNLTQ